MNNKFGPCIEKKCALCCNPVKVDRHFQDKKIPVDRNGDKLWVDRGEIMIPEEHSDTVRLKTFDCRNFDSGTGQCKDYEGRPDICRNTSCVNGNVAEGIDEQHKKFASEKYISVKK